MLPLPTILADNASEAQDIFRASLGTAAIRPSLGLACIVLPMLTGSALLVAAGLAMAATLQIKFAAQ